MSPKKELKDTVIKNVQPKYEEFDKRWLYLVNVAERLSELYRAGCLDADSILALIEGNMIDLNEVFSRDIDPISDLEGYAVRRLSQEILILVKAARLSQKDQM